MNEQAERIPVDDGYLRALGRAAYNFAYLEWDIIWLTETMRKGFLRQASQLTAGLIACEFSREVERLDDTDRDKVRLQSLANDFKEIVKNRNSLMHGNPHTAEADEQCLLYDGEHGRRDWTVNAMEQFAASAATASIEAGKLLHGGRLERYQATDTRDHDRAGGQAEQTK